MISENNITIVLDGDQHKSYLQQFQEILMELRPSFFEDQTSDTLTIIEQHEGNDSDEQILFVETNAFYILCYLYNKIKRKYQHKNQYSSIIISNPSNQVLSINLNKSLTPPQLVVTKLFRRYHVSRLWGKRIPFILSSTDIIYRDVCGLHKEFVDGSLYQQVKEILSQNAKSSVTYQQLDGTFIDRVELYSGDMVLFRSPDFHIEYFPVSDTNRTKSFRE